MPRELYFLSDLSNLTLTHNALEGNLSPDVQLMSNLEALDVSHNSLGGSLPTELGLLSELTYLDISFNQFGGTIPTKLIRLTNRTELDLSYNDLTGTIPTELGRLFRKETLASDHQPPSRRTRSWVRACVRAGALWFGAIGQRLCLSNSTPSAAAAVTDSKKLCGGLVVAFVCARTFAVSSFEVPLRASLPPQTPRPHWCSLLRTSDCSLDGNCRVAVAVVVVVVVVVVVCPCRRSDLFLLLEPFLEMSDYRIRKMLRRWLIRLDCSVSGGNERLRHPFVQGGQGTKERRKGVWIHRVDRVESSHLQSQHLSAAAHVHTPPKPSQQTEQSRAEYSSTIPIAVTGGGIPDAVAKTKPDDGS